MGLQQITRQQLTDMRKTYLGVNKLGKPPQNPKETRSCLLSLSDISNLIDHYKNIIGSNRRRPIDGFRVYFYRPDPTKVSGPKGKLIIKRKLTIYNVAEKGQPKKGQLSIILVPTCNYKSKPFGADNMYDPKSGKCWVLTPGGEHTGLCPTNCGGNE